MKGCQSVLIRRGLDWEDVTDKYVVIYGAGQGCIYMMSELQLPNVKYIIDSDERQWGKQLILLDQIYTVHSPELLTELPKEDYYLIISSEKYADEIRVNIDNYVDCEKITICMHQKYLAFSYDSLENLLFYDPRIKKSLLKANWTRKIDHLRYLFISVTKKIFPEKTINCFMSTWSGASKILFCFCVDKIFYSFSIPALYCETSTTLFPHNPDERKKRYQFRKKYNIGNEMTVYEEDTGVLIQFWADSFVDFREECHVESVLKKCYELHQLDYRLEVKHNFGEEMYSAASIILKRVAPWEYEKIKELNYQSKLLFDEIKKIGVKQKICHGDLNCTNVVSWKNDVLLIDWEHMSMSDPLYDVCRFLFHRGIYDSYLNKLSYIKASRQIYASLRHYLSFYYGRICTDEEYYHGYLVMQAIECSEILRSASWASHVEEERYVDLLERLKYREVK
ncbi:hypothetical protein C818_02128 [Lachnospiraceae bacterium MD308]|nr:hypothetical protein C818_02128 [Lachnospiraceae bacterium MD308]